MVSYCCVKGCHNNSNHKKKDPNSVISFHAFPSNPEHKLKWLRAIGRPDWEPPSHSRVCSAHFKFDQINHDSCRTRIKDDAFPVFALPPNSNFEASHIEVCRICLASDLRMYSLKDGDLRTAMESVAGFNENYNIEGLPQFVCYECAATLMKCNRLIEKSMIAQATLLDIFAENGQITKNLIKKQNRNQLNLKSLLCCHKVQNHYELKYDYDNLSYGIRNDKINNDYIQTNDSKIDLNIHEEHLKIDAEEHLKNEVTGTEANDSEEILLEENDKANSLVHDPKTSVEVNFINTDSHFNDHEDTPTEFISSPIDDIVMSDDENKFVDDVKPKRISKRKKHKGYDESESKKSKRKSVNGLTPDEVDMQKYFTIVRLSLEDQIEEWDRTPMKRHLTSETMYECEVCSKLFAHVNSYRNHIANHDPSRGKVECPVCKLRFKTDVLAKYHLNRAHAKKFYCKTCHKVFNNVGVAKKHHRWHTGYTYRCSVAGCTFSSAHESARGAHARTHHAHAHACAHCGRAFTTDKGLRLHTGHAHRELQDVQSNNTYRCEECNLSFSSEGARRVHLLTSTQHKKKSDLCDTTPRDPSLQTTCSKCGMELKSLRELIAHTKAEHPRPSQKRTMYRLPDDKYPIGCDHCGEEVKNRKEHWWHVRRQHPKLKHSYRPVVTAVCDTCGKGFQNSTKLSLHRLRHRSPSVPCALCPRLFYDKYAVARHAAVHSAASPHTCRICGRGFKLKCYLERHARVHTGVTPYECTICDKKFKFSTSLNLHVRTVHYKLPHPPRKKRTCKATRNSNLVDTINDNVM